MRERPDEISQTRQHCRKRLVGCERVGRQAAHPESQSDATSFFPRELPSEEKKYSPYCQEMTHISTNLRQNCKEAANKRELQSKPFFKAYTIMHVLSRGLG